MRTVNKAAFHRGLDRCFMDALTAGAFTPILDAAKSKSLDVQIRENYLDIYSRGRRVLSLEHVPRDDRYRAKIHHKFLASVPTEGLDLRMSGNCARISAHDGFVDWYLANIDRIIANANATAKAEATVEEYLIRASHEPTAPVTFIDRQVQLHGVRQRMDLLGIGVDDGGPRILLTEVKQGLDNRIQDLIEQTGEYYRLIAPDGYLRDDVLRSYQMVVKQKRELGLIGTDVHIPDDRLPVECLLVLYDYNERSQLLGRLRENSGACTFPVWLVRLGKGRFGLPASNHWEKLS